MSIRQCHSRTSKFSETLGTPYQRTTALSNHRFVVKNELWEGVYPFVFNKTGSRVLPQLSERCIQSYKLRNENEKQQKKVFKKTIRKLARRRRWRRRRRRWRRRRHCRWPSDQLPKSCQKKFFSIFVWPHDDLRVVNRGMTGLACTGWHHLHQATVRRRD